MNACLTFAVGLLNCWLTFESPLHKVCCKIITGPLEVLVPRVMHAVPSVSVAAELLPKTWNGRIVSHQSKAKQKCEEDS